MLSRFTGRRRKDVDCGKTSGGNGPASKHKRTLEIEQLERLYVPAVLETHGYSARSDKEWQSLPVPQLHISVKKAAEQKLAKQTQYVVECHLVMPASESSSESTVTWSVRRRLQAFRCGLHAFVKHELGADDYAAFFMGTPFAHRCGRTGTTGRLNAWCARLAYIANHGQAPPVVVHRIFKVLGAPARSLDLRADAVNGKVSLTDSLAEYSTTASELGEDFDSEIEIYESDFESYAPTELDYSDDDSEECSSDAESEPQEGSRSETILGSGPVHPGCPQVSTLEDFIEFRAANEADLRRCLDDFSAPTRDSLDDFMDSRTTR